MHYISNALSHAIHSNVTSTQDLLDGIRNTITSLPMPFSKEREIQNGSPTALENTVSILEIDPRHENHPVVQKIRICEQIISNSYRYFCVRIPS